MKTLSSIRLIIMSDHSVKISLISNNTRMLSKHMVISIIISLKLAFLISNLKY